MDLIKLNNFLKKSPDIYIRQYEYTGIGKIDLSEIYNAKLTPETNPRWDIGKFESEASNNLYIFDDNNVFTTNIVTNSKNTIMFDESEIKHIADERIKLKLKNGKQYQFQILSPHKFYEYGNFLGYIGEGVFEEFEETVLFRHGMPKRTIREEVINEGIKLKTKLFTTDATLKNSLSNFVKLNDDISEIKSDENKYYQITLVSGDVNGKSIKLTIIMGTFEIKTSKVIFGEGYKAKEFEFTTSLNALFPNDSDIYIMEFEK